MKKLFALMALSSAIFAQTATAPKPVAEVNGTKVSIEDVKSVIVNEKNRNSEMQQKAQQDFKSDMLKSNINAAIDATLLYQDAIKKGVDKSPELTQKIEALKKQLIYEVYVEKILLPSITISDEEINNRYKSDWRYYRPEQFMGVIAEIPDASKEAEARAALEKYAKAAETPTNEPGGNTQPMEAMKKHMEITNNNANSNGFFTFQTTVTTNDRYHAVMQKDISASSKGKILGPYKMDNGSMFMFLVVDRVPEQITPLEKVRAEIIDMLRLEKLPTVRTQKIDELKNNATITIFYDAIPRD